MIRINRNTTKSRILQECWCETTIHLCIVNSSSKLDFCFSFIFHCNSKASLQIEIISRKSYNFCMFINERRVLFLCQTHFCKTKTKKKLYRIFLVNHRITGQATDAEWNLQLVSKYILLFPTKCSHMEGIYYASFIHSFMKCPKMPSFKEMRFVELSRFADWIVEFAFHWNGLS